MSGFYECPGRRRDLRTLPWIDGRGLGRGSADFLDKGWLEQLRVDLEEEVTLIGAGDFQKFGDEVLFSWRECSAFGAVLNHVSGGSSPCRPPLIAKAGTWLSR